jgi:predicted dehydrogenase
MEGEARRDSMTKPIHLSRRQLLVEGVAAFALPLLVPSQVLGKPRRPGANDRIRLGFIGVGRRGQQLLEAMPEGAKVVAVCDVYRPRAEVVGAKYHAKAVHDFRRVLDRKDMDVVVIATPDHWHALPAVLACQAGKDVYCEKPLALTVREGRLMVKAARKYHRVFQVGTQQRSLRPNRIACKIVRSGAMGAVKRVIVSNNRSPSGDWLPREDVPEGLDWSQWLGQAPDIPYNNKYLFPENEPGWSSRYAFSGGEMCGWGAHGFDQVQWALGMDDSGPVEVYAGDDPDQPDDARVRWMYPGGVVVETGDAPKPGGKFFCERGQIDIDRNRFNVMPEGLKRELLRGVDVAETAEENHMRDFLERVRTRRRPDADAEIGQRSVTVAHLGNIARWVGGRLAWDPVAERFTNSDKANGHLDRERRKGYEMPGG